MALPIPGFSEPFSSISHLLSAFASLVGGCFLLKKGWGNFLRVFALLVYIFGMIFLFTMSGVYHLLEPGHLPRLVMQRLDHAAIWLMIAGSFTPIHIILFRSFWRWGVLGFIWTFAITGLVLKTVFFTDIPQWASIGCYLSLGWLGTLSAWQLNRQFGIKNAAYVLLGGLAYSFGAILEGTTQLVIIPGVIETHEVFHIFVTLGAALHWKFIYDNAAEPVFDHLVFRLRSYAETFFVAKAIGEPIYVEADSTEAVRKQIDSAISKRFSRLLKPKLIIIKKEEIL